MGQESADTQGSHVGAVGEYIEEIPVEELECCFWEIVRAGAKAAVGFVSRTPQFGHQCSLLVPLHETEHKDEQVWCGG